jgi:hypothetical protein
VTAVEVTGDVGAAGAVAAGVAFDDAGEVAHFCRLPMGPQVWPTLPPSSTAAAPSTASVAVRTPKR